MSRVIGLGLAVAGFAATGEFQPDQPPRSERSCDVDLRAV